MQTYIALFRGINVGGNSKLPMKELTTLLEGLGCQSVKTYIQSGNVAFQSRAKNPARLSQSISAEIKKSHGIEPLVLLLTLEEMKEAARSNPFAEAESEPQTLHVGFLASVPENPDLKALAALAKENERFHLSGNVFYLHAPDGVGRSKLAAKSEKLLGVSMTDRNWRTVCKIVEMAEEI